MKQVLCAWFPNWAIQRIRHTKPQLEQRPVVLYRDSGQRGARVVARSAEAALQDIAIGMSVAEAQSLIIAEMDRSARQTRPTRATDSSDIEIQTHFEEHDLDADNAALKTLAYSCQQFSPIYGVEEADAAESLLIDVTGCEHLFGDENGLAADVYHYFDQQGYRTRIAIASTIGVAWAVSHFSGLGSPRCVFVVPSSEHERLLRPLPIEALRIPDSALQPLHRLDVHTIGRLLDLPRSDLPSRFGTALIQQIDQTLGEVVETFTPERPPEPIQAEWASDDLISDRRHVEAILKRLLIKIVDKLIRMHLGTEHIRCRLDHSRGRSSRIDVGLIHPSNSFQHLLELLQMQFDAADFSDGVSHIRMRARVTGLLAVRQQELFGNTNEDESRQVDVLVDRLSNRLGNNAVLRPELTPDVQPESSGRFKPLVGSKSWSSSALENGSHTPHPETLRPSVRPLTMLAIPEPIEVMLAAATISPKQFLWKKKTHTIANSWGPERIETAWWEAEPVERDYYRVETSNGARYWLYACAITGKWFVHGIFG